MSLSPPSPSAHSSPRRRLRRLAAGLAALLAAASGLVLASGQLPARAATSTATSAWRNGTFALSPDGVVSRDDIVLGQPNVNPTGSIPLGNGGLGVAAWAANGFTAQLNRSDTMPDRKSPGQVTIPGLSVISHASDFSGKLDLTDGVLEESGGGMSMKAWVSTAKDELIIDVSGANPGIAQTASLYLWSGRNPTAAVSGTVGSLAETWVDNSEPQPSGRTFGSLSAITAGGRDVRASVTSPTRVQVSFKPNANGDFRVVVAAPSWNGSSALTASQTATRLIGHDASVQERSLLASQSRWWGSFWSHSGLVEMSSADGSAAYIENLRTLYLYEEAASEKAGIYPGNQAGDADMFDWSQDEQTWTPSSYWIWNLRAEISANMSSGNYQLNTPIFDMYINDLPAIETWTKATMGGLPGACVPETMRFNGNGGDPASGSCTEAASPLWNALDITSGPEMSLYMWEQYQATGDRAFLKKAFPFMEATAQFLLAYQKVGPDGLLHAVANAHETQWAVQDPTTDIVADQTIFPIIGQAARLVGDTSSSDPLLAQFSKAITEIPPYPRTDDATRTQLLNPDYTQAETQAADATGTDMIAISYQPTAQRQNDENIELEPLWPWDQVSDQDAGLFALEQRSYASRPNKGGNDWSYDAVDAARLEQPSQVESNLLSLTESHQVYPNGFADLGSSVGYQPYMEQSAGVATAVDEALAQDYDGIIRFAPAWPSDWDGSGTVYIAGNDKVDVQVENGQLVTAAIQAASSGQLTVKSPWPGQQVEVVSGSGQHRLIARTSTSDVFTFRAQAGQSYLVQQVSAPTTALAFAPVTGTPATTDRHLGGKVQIGLDPAGPATTAVVGTVLAATNVSDGVTQADYAGTGESAQTTASDVAGLSARTTTGSATENDLYFTISPSVAATSSYNATITVSYYDSGTGTVALQYDNGPMDPYHTAGTLTETGTDTWKTASFTVSGAYFGGLENAGADFRLDGQQPITVHSVGVSVTGPAVPAGVQFPPAPTITTPHGGQTVKLESAISGTSEPDARVTVTEGQAALCTATATDGGAWSCTPASGLPQGKQSVTATATDPTGLVSTASAAVSFDASDLPPGTAVVASVLGPANYSYGMSENSAAYDGPTTGSDIDGLSALASTDSNIYFSVNDSVAYAGDYSATFKVQYYDSGTGSFQVQYDDGTSNPYKAATPNIQLTNTDTWKTATVTGTDAYFGNKQNGGADFRLRNGGGQVTVHSVAVAISGDGVANVTDFPPAVAIVTPAAAATVTTTPAVSGTSEPDATVTVDANGQAICSATASDSGAWSCTPASALADGAYTLTATAADALASPVTSPSVQVTVQG
ncbi:MAG TPA: Ig-like domain-containing protein [Trebonia sp.]|nr:Ig-like domain-containing protein [Trebonia sp.]